MTTRNWTATFGQAICPIDGTEFTRKVINHTYCDILCQEVQQRRDKKKRYHAMKMSLAQAQV